MFHRSMLTKAKFSHPPDKCIDRKFDQGVIIFLPLSLLFRFYPAIYQLMHKYPKSLIYSTYLPIHLKKYWDLCFEKNDFIETKTLPLIGLQTNLAP